MRFRGTSSASGEGPSPRRQQRGALADTGKGGGKVSPGPAAARRLAGGARQPSPSRAPSWRGSEAPPEKKKK
ncbi:hypothetical protein NL676_020798 [Syzygium grande]|nr:hypothetical protein NL676_020798 [Syzygium grande]